MIKITSNDYKGPTWAFIFCAKKACYIMRRINAGVGTELTVEANLYL